MKILLELINSILIKKKPLKKENIIYILIKKKTDSVLALQLI